eukprot:279817-Pyramimonas_sp.AAC.1
MLSMPPNTFRKVDLVAMAGWRPPPVPRSAQISAVAAAIRSATYTPRGEREPFLARLRDTAWEE